jgi:nucleoside-diphosphate-sugar epimerase
MANILVAGCGDVGTRVARREQESGHSVSGLVRSEPSAQRLRQAGITPITYDLDITVYVPPLPDSIDVLYYFVPPPSTGKMDPRIDYFLQMLAKVTLPGRFVLLSTTGVYGDCDGAWITEQTPARPQTDRARRRLWAEQTLQRWAARNKISHVILRVPGIYGPGKLPVTRLQQQKPVLAPEQSPWSNRVHIDDLVSACVAAGHHAEPKPVYNISDGHPSTMTDYFYRVADALGLERPPAISLEQARQSMSDGMLSYLEESKRIDNTLMREHLGVDPVYWDLEEGIRESKESKGSDTIDR